MKKIKLIENLVERAKTLSQETHDGFGVARHVRQGEVVYEVTMDMDNQMATLMHYGTVTIMYNLLSGVLEEWYGEGVSDRDSMNTFLHALDGNRYHFRFGSVMGFVMEYDGVRHELGV